MKAVAEAMVERDPNVLCCIKRHAPKNETPRTLNGTEVSSVAFGLALSVPVSTGMVQHTARRIDYLVGAA